ncbi:glycoside hydrolase family 18 protein [Aspergillus mulundensis]|uniref:chitinase n=1 Tax=Aspergillus mulundensis TaxID=1810919 RepID=A0A3D8T3L0_9EURO|nr:hypothetical protein DSM5745_00442 [Aspergillus mulundensis]RDW93120.1 hypothetical protein DSM5745_00442 [Aspergillus mulundensis]
MVFFKRFLGAVAGLVALQTAYAALDLSSNSTIVVYWGQNSFQGTGDLAQQRLGNYCEDSNIDVLVLAFLTTINGPGGAPEINFANASDNCTTFSGTNLLNCPEIGEDIAKCQAADKTILLSIGGATYTEGGFASETAANAGADLLWATFGPDNGDTTVHRPFGEAVIDGFDFDFEATVSNTGAFVTRLRSLADADTSKEYYLTAAPQCPFPDAADKDILNTDSSAAIDAVFVQFYNNYCGVNAYSPARKIPISARTKADAKLRARANDFNFDVWDNWALTESKNKNVRVFLGVAANTGAASTGYLPVASLEPVISYSQGFESFGGVMMWDVSQAYGNPGFLDGIAEALGREATTHSPTEPESPQQPQQQDDAASSAQQSQSESATATASNPSQQPQQQNDAATSTQQGQSESATVTASTPPQQPPQQDDATSSAQQGQNESATPTASTSAQQDQNESATATASTSAQQDQNESATSTASTSAQQDQDESATSTAGTSAQQGQNESATATASTAPQQQQPQETPAAPQESAGEQQQNQDVGDDQDRPSNLLPSLLGPVADLGWIQI